MSKFSRAHYEVIANAIAWVSESVSIGNITEAEAFDALVEVLRNEFIKDNPKFNDVKFVKACLEVK